MSRTPCSITPNTTPPTTDRARHPINCKARTRRSNTTSDSNSSKLEVLSTTSNQHMVLSRVSNNWRHTRITVSLSK